MTNRRIIGSSRTKGASGGQRNNALPRQESATVAPRRGSPADAGKNKEINEAARETLQRLIETATNQDLLQLEDSERKQMILQEIEETLQEVIREKSFNFSRKEYQSVVDQISDEIFGYGPINYLINDSSVSEIMVNGPNRVYVERNGRLERTNAKFRDDAHVMHTIDKIITPLGRRVDENSPMVDARLPDGSRVNAIIPPLAVKGPNITIRKFSADPYTAHDLLSLGTFSEEMMQFLKACVKSKVNVMVSGGSGTGKTTLLNVLSSFIPHTERIITIEDAAELQMKQEHVVTLESRPPNIEGTGAITIRDLVINALRMRPDRIVVGEVRGGESLDMLQAMNTGHEGSLSTLHANSPRDALARLETMVLMAGLDLPMRAIREQVAAAVELIVQLQRFSDGSRRVVKISEVLGMESDTITMQDIFVFQAEGFDEKGEVTGHFASTGIMPHFVEKLRASGEELPAWVFEEQSDGSGASSRTRRPRRQGEGGESER